MVPSLDGKTTNEHGLWDLHSEPELVSFTGLHSEADSGSKHVPDVSVLLLLPCLPTLVSKVPKLWGRFTVRAGHHGVPIFCVRLDTP